MGLVVTLDNGQRVHYRDYGGQGAPVLMIHSFLMDYEMFAPQVAELGEQFRLIGVDARGHGGTPGETPFDYWDIARDMIGLMDALALDQAAVMGTSQGGFIALRMAILAPERISALCLMGTCATAEAPDTAMAYRNIVADWAQNGPDAQVDMVASLSMGDFDATEIKKEWRKVDGEQLVRNMEALAGRDGLLPRLGEVRCPVLILHGSSDAAYALRRAEEIAEGVAAAEPLVVIEGGSHYLSLTHPQAINPHLSRFLTNKV